MSDHRGTPFGETGLLRIVSEYWWVSLLRGVLAILFGLVAIMSPGLTLFWLIWIFGIYAIIDGVTGIWSGFRHRGEVDYWWTEILIGLAGVAAGFLAIVWPGLSAVALIYFIGSWMVVTGVLTVAYAIRIRKEVTNEVWIALSGILSVLLGLYFMVFPGDGAISLVWVIGVYAIMFGVFLVLFAFKARNGFDGLASGA